MECRSEGLACRIHGLGFRFQMQHVFGGWCVGVRSQHLTMYVLRTRLCTERERETWLNTLLTVGHAKETAVEEVGPRMVQKKNFDKLALNLNWLESHPGWREGLGLSNFTTRFLKIFVNFCYQQS